MEPIKVVIHGAGGRMGREVINSLCKDPGMDPVGAVDITATEEYLSLPDGSGLIPFSTNLADMIARCLPQVVVDFTNNTGAMGAIRTVTAHKVNMVCGSTGLTEADIKEAEGLTQKHGVGVVIAPNFALGAVLLIDIARKIGPLFDYAEIVESHHEKKIDAPSGTALAIAKALMERKSKSFKAPKPDTETLKGTRGGDYQGVTIHSSRMPGRMAMHELTLGIQGQTITVTHDTINRECYMPGVMMAVREVAASNRFILGLDTILGL